MCAMFTTSSLTGILSSVGNIFNSIYAMLDSVVLYELGGSRITLFTFGMFFFAVSFFLIIYMRFRQSPPL